MEVSDQTDIVPDCFSNIALHDLIVEDIVEHLDCGRADRTNNLKGLGAVYEIPSGDGLQYQRHSGFLCQRGHFLQPVDDALLCRRAVLVCVVTGGDDNIGAIKLLCNGNGLPQTRKRLFALAWVIQIAAVFGADRCDLQIELLLLCQKLLPVTPKPVPKLYGTVAGLTGQLHSCQEFIRIGEYGTRRTDLQIQQINAKTTFHAHFLHSYFDGTFLVVSFDVFIIWIPFPPCALFFRTL